MKVALFSDTYYPQINGVSNTLNKLIKYFKEHGIEYKIFAPEYGTEDKDKDKKTGENTERFYSLKFFLYPECRLAIPNVFRVTKSLNEFKPDIIHLMTEFNMGVCGLNYGKKNDIPTISNYTTNFSQYTEYYNLEIFKKPIWDYMRWFHNQNDITLCPSNDARRVLNENGIENTEIFTRGIDFEKFNPKFRSKKKRRKLGVKGKITFLYVGRVAFEKDLDVLAEAYGKIKDRYGEKVALIITGDGPYLEKCKEIFPDDTIYTGFKNGRKLAEIYASSDIFVCPSSTETFGNVVLEAMSSGLAVIGANAGGVNEIIEEGYNGLKFEAKNSESLYLAMSKLAEDREFSRYLVSNALKTSRERSWNKIIGDLMSIYYNVIDSKRGKILETA